MFRLRAESEDLLALDVLRFAAAAGVVVLHYGGEFLRQIGLGAAADNLAFLNLAVDVFFVISGFVIMHVYGQRIRGWRSAGVFLWRRVARLVPLHWLTLLFFVLAGAVIGVFGLKTSAPGAFAWGDLFEVAFLLHAFGGVNGYAFNFPAWSISAEMVMYALFPLLLLPRVRWALPLIIIAAAGWLAWGELGGRGSAHWYEPNALRAFVGFPLGMMLRLALRPSRASPLWLSLAAAALISLCVMGVLGAHTLALVGAAYAIAVFAIMSDVSGYKSDWLKAVAPLGALTYSIYMLHIPVKTAMSYIATMTGQTFEASWLWLALTTVMLALASWLSFFCFETPARQALNRLVSSRTQEAAPGAATLAR